MEFRKLELKNFGKFQNETITFHEGMNLLYGENEAGKSTIYQALKATLFGMERGRGRVKNDAYSRYEPWENPSYYAATLTFTAQGRDYRIERSFHKSERRSQCVCETTGECLDIEGGELTALLGGITENSYRNTMAIGQLSAPTDQSLVSQLQNYAANYYGAGTANVDVEQALTRIREERKTAVKALQKLGQKRDCAIEELEKRRTHLLREQEGKKRDLEKEQERLRKQAAEQEAYETQAGRLAEMETRLHSAQEESVRKLNTLYERSRQIDLRAEQEEEKLAKERENYGKEVEKVEERKRRLQYEANRFQKLARTALVAGILAVLLLMMGAAASRFVGHGEAAVLRGGAWVHIFSIEERGTYVIGGLLSALLLITGVLLLRRSARIERIRESILLPRPMEAARELLKRLGEQGEETALQLEACEEELARLSDREEKLQIQLKEIRDKKEEITFLGHRIQGQIEQLQSFLQDMGLELTNLQERYLELEGDNAEREKWGRIRDASRLAEQHLLEITEELHGQFGHALHKRASGILKEITEGAYDNLLMEEDGTLILNTPNRRISVEEVSRGTLEQVYFALRMAVMDCLYKEDYPIILDDAFAFYDDKRLKQTLHWLLQNRKQVILFTCQEREGRIISSESPLLSR